MYAILSIYYCSYEIIMKNGWRQYYNENQDKGSNCDLIARETIKYHLPIIFPTISNITDDPFGMYDIDLAGIITTTPTVLNPQPSSQSTSTIYIEAELRLVDSRVWQLRAPIRKLKYFSDRKNTLYIHINRPQTRMAIIKGSHLINSKKVNIPNRYNPQGEQFFVPSTDLVHFYDITPLERFNNIDMNNLGLMP